MIVQLGKNDVVRVARANAGLPSSQEETTHVDEEFLAACLRRVAGFHCPCSASTWDDGAHEPAGTPHAQA